MVKLGQKWKRRSNYEVNNQVNENERQVLHMYALSAWEWSLT